MRENIYAFIDNFYADFVRQLNAVLARRDISALLLNMICQKRQNICASIGDFSKILADAMMLIKRRLVVERSGILSENSLHSDETCG